MATFLVSANGNEPTAFEALDPEDALKQYLYEAAYDSVEDAAEACNQTVEEFRADVKIERVRERRYWTVAIYLVDQAWGGPEEGGWWYTCGERLMERAPKVFRDERAAWTYARRLNDWLNRIANRGRRPISSVLSEGQYGARVFEGDAPGHFPEHRPHYE